MAKNRRSSGVGSSDPTGAAAGLSRSGKPGGVSGRLVNVFEQLWNRRKFDILGRKVKGDVRAKSIGKARSAAVEKRKATLLQEFQQRGKANLFLDRRFGEGDESIPEGEKAIVRFQKERMAQLSRKNRFSLGDDDESEDDDGGDDDGGGGGAGRRSSRRAAASEDGDLRLTHGGRDIDDFDDSDVSGFGEDEDDDDGALGGQIVSEYHFGGGFVPKAKSATDTHLDAATEQGKGGEERQKTKREVMEEVMAKSKLFKAKRQAEKEEDEHLREQLDADFRQIAQSDALLALTRAPKGGKGKEKAGGGEGKAAAAAAPAAASVGATAGTAGGGAAKAPAAGSSLLAADVAEEEMDDKQYDVLAREMVFDIRAKPGERTKTAEEAAEAERARLVKLEAARKRRMDGEPSDEEEGEEGEEGSSEEEGGKGRKRRQRKKVKREISGDDLGENFVLEADEEDEEEKKGWVYDVLGQKEEESEDESGSEGEEEEEEEDEAENLADVDWEQSDEEIGGERVKGKRGSVRDGAVKQGEEESEEEEEGEEREEGEESDEEEEAEEEKVQEKQKQEGRKAAAAAAEQEEQEEEEEEEEEDEEEEEEENERIERVFRRRELPYVIEAPQQLKDLQRLLEGRAAAEVGVAIARIRACNAAHLSPDNKRKMQIFYNVLLQYFASLASDSGDGGVSQRVEEEEDQPGKKQKQQHEQQQKQQGSRQQVKPQGGRKVEEGKQEGEEQEEEEEATSELQKRAPSVAAAHINALVQPLVELSASFPLFAAVCARERLARMQKRLVARLKAGEPAWPTARTLLLLRLWALIFPSSDFRHPVMTPVSLLLGQFLSCCPVRSTKDVAAGLFISALLLNMVSQSRRFVPEALNFLHALLWSAVAPALKPVKPKGVPRYMLLQVCSQQWLWAPCGDGSNHRKRKREPLEDQPQALDFDRIFLGPSCPSNTPSTAETTTSTTANPFVSKASPSASPAAPPTLLGVEGSAAGTVAEAYFGSDVFRLSLLLAVLKTLRSFALLYRPMQPFPEIFAPFLPTLAALAESGQLPEEIEQERAAWVKDIEGAVAEVEGSRQPLRLRVKRAVPAKQFNPKFESDFARGKDYDPNRERAEQRRLQRAIKREARGAARELRKDNQFLAAARANEAANALEERREKNQRAMAFMEQQAHLMCQKGREVWEGYSRAAAAGERREKEEQREVQASGAKGREVWEGYLREAAAAEGERREKNQWAMAFMEQQAHLMWSGQLGRKRGGMSSGKGRR
ncbi:unnamed protein product [Closterium sp. NIES-54]